MSYKNVSGIVLALMFALAITLGSFGLPQEILPNALGSPEPLLMDLTFGDPCVGMCYPEVPTALGGTELSHIGTSYQGKWGKNGEQLVCNHFANNPAPGHELVIANVTRVQLDCDLNASYEATGVVLGPNDSGEAEFAVSPPGALPIYDDHVASYALGDYGELCFALCGAIGVNPTYFGEWKRLSGNLVCDPNGSSQSGSWDEIEGFLDCNLSGNFNDYAIVLTSNIIQVSSP